MFFRGGVGNAGEGKEDKKCGEGVQNFLGEGVKEDEMWGGGVTKKNFCEEYNNNLRQLLASIEK